MTLSIKKKINSVTSPFRAFYATLGIVLWEILSLGMLPNPTAMWKYAYDYLKISEDDCDEVLAFGD